MNNGHTPSDFERKEPKLSPFSHMDETGDQQFSAQPTSATPAFSGPVVVQTKASNAGLWVIIVLLLIAVSAIAGYGYLELTQLQQMQSRVVKQVNSVVAAANTIDSKLNESGGLLAQSQSSLNDQVTALESLESKFGNEFKALQSTTGKNASELTALQQKLDTSLASQTKTLIAATEPLAKKFELLAKADQTQFEQTQTLKKDVTQLQAQLKEDISRVTQAMGFLEEELAAAPADEVKTLQDQFAVYMQSVDRFRQQTNASLNDMSSQVRQLERNQARIQSTPSGQPLSDFDFERQ